MDFKIGDCVTYNGKNKSSVKFGESYHVRGIKDGKILVKGYWHLPKNFIVNKEKGVDSDVRIRDAEEKLVKDVGNHPGTASYAIVRERGVSYHVRDVCHYRICNNNNGHGAVLGVINNISGYYKTHKDWGSEDKYIRFTKWFIQESFMKDVFIQEDFYNILEGCVRLNIGKPIHMLMAACIGLRQYTEKGLFRELFDTLVDKGVDKTVAFLIAQYFHKNGNQYYLKTYSDNHSLVDCTRSFVSTYRALSKGIECKGVSYALEPYVLANRIFDIFCKPDDRFSSGFFKGIVKNKPGAYGNCYYVTGSIVKFAKEVEERLE